MDAMLKALRPGDALVVCGRLDQLSRSVHRTCQLNERLGDDGPEVRPPGPARTWRV
ncbi:MAG TPA: hypothetical protein VGO93_12615 [Candidatus Xenobia bacterium]